LPNNSNAIRETSGGVIVRSVFTQGGRKHLAAPPRHAWRWLKGLTAAHVARKAFAEAADEADNLVGGTPRADNPVANFLAKGRPEK